MIKISKGIYIHFLTVLLFIFCYINRKLEILAISYISIFVHEIAHLTAAIAIGLLPSRIIFLPFGVNLKLKNTIKEISAGTVNKYKNLCKMGFLLFDV